MKAYVNIIYKIKRLNILNPHAIEYLKGSGVIVDVIVNLRPTAPLRSIDDIDNAIQMLIVRRNLSISLS